MSAPASSLTLHTRIASACTQALVAGALALSISAVMLMIRLGGAA
jgi:hypothetical protein